MKDPKFAADGAPDEDDTSFLPVEIVAEPAPTAPLVEPTGLLHYRADSERM